MADDWMVRCHSKEGSDILDTTTESGETGFMEGQAVEVYVPETLVKAIRYYSDIDIATKTFAALRWPDGPVCPHLSVEGKLLRPKPSYLEV